MLLTFAKSCKEKCVGVALQTLPSEQSVTFDEQLVRESMSPIAYHSNIGKPCVMFVNVWLCCLPGEGQIGQQATILLENPVGMFPQSASDLHGQVCRMWHI